MTELTFKHLFTFTHNILHSKIVYTKHQFKSILFINKNHAKHKPFKNVFLIYRLFSPIFKFNRIRTMPYSCFVIHPSKMIQQNSIFLLTSFFVIFIFICFLLLSFAGTDKSYNHSKYDRFYWSLLGYFTNAAVILVLLHCSKIVRVPAFIHIIKLK